MPDEKDMETFLSRLELHCFSALEDLRRQHCADDVQCDFGALPWLDKAYPLERKKGDAADESYTKQRDHSTIAAMVVAVFLGQIRDKRLQKRLPETFRQRLNVLLMIQRDLKLNDGARHIENLDGHRDLGGEAAFAAHALSFTYLSRHLCAMVRRCSLRPDECHQLLEGSIARFLTAPAPDGDGDGKLVVHDGALNKSCLETIRARVHTCIGSFHHYRSRILYSMYQPRFAVISRGFVYFFNLIAIIVMASKGIETQESKYYGLGTGAINWIALAIMVYRQEFLLKYSDERVRQLENESHWMVPASGNGDGDGDGRPLPRKVRIPYVLFLGMPGCIAFWGVILDFIILLFFLFSKCC